MSMNSGAQRSSEAEVQAPGDGVRCDFCGERVSRVQRIALDGDYERLCTPHKIQYACEACSERKEARRRQLQAS